MRKTKNPACCQQLGSQKANYIDDISLPAQRQRLLYWLQEKPITTIQTRKLLNILAPAARIWELRHKSGYNIVTNRIMDITSEGKHHSVARYSLLPGEYKSNGGDKNDK